MRALLAVVVLCSVLPCAANAAVVTSTREFVPGPKGTDTYITHVLVDAGPGERNDLTIADVGPDALLVRDAATSLRAGEGCSATADGVTCAVTGSVDLVVRAGDGDDVVHVSGRSVAHVDGGDGDDVVESTASFGYLDGGAGADDLTGGPTGEVLDGGPGADRMTGGEGQDSVSYAGRTAAITARIGSAGNGEPGEGDTIGADVERLVGGAGDDTLVGDDGPNEISGNGGDDQLDGQGGGDRLDGDAYGEAQGADVLHGGGGPDALDVGKDDSAFGGEGQDVLAVAGHATVDGGPGEDLVQTSGAGARVEARDDARDTIACGRGALASLRIDRRDVPLRCGSAVRRRAAAAAVVLELYGDFDDEETPRTVIARVACPDDAGARCSAGVVLRAGGTTVARRRVTVRAGRQQQVGLALPAAQRRRLRRAGELSLAVTVTARDRRGVLRTDRATALLRPQRDPLAPA